MGGKRKEGARIKAVAGKKSQVALPVKVRWRRLPVFRKWLLKQHEGLSLYCKLEAGGCACPCFDSVTFY